jgi:hypothetical protein
MNRKHQELWSLHLDKNMGSVSFKNPLPTELGNYYD